MKAVTRIIVLGDLTLWGRQFLAGLKATGMEISHEPNLQKFIESQPSPQPQIIFLENLPESRQYVAKLRTLSRRIYWFWFGRNFTKDDATFALENRAYHIFENLRPDDKRISEFFGRLAANMETDTEFERTARGIKGVLIQAETEIPKAVLSEIKTGIAKMERLGLINEFSGATIETIVTSDGKLPFHKTQSLADALLTIESLERTGVLWIKGSIRGEEGKVEFLQGKAMAAKTGDVHALKALYRMFLWDDPRFLFTRRETSESTTEDQLNVSLSHVCSEGEALKKRYEAVRRELPPPDLRLELQPSALHTGTMLDFVEFSTLASIVEFHRVADVLDFNNLPDVSLYESLIKLRRQNIIRVSVAANA